MINILKLSFLIIFSIALLSDCSRTIAITKTKRYQSKLVDITTNDGAKYTLASGWQVDSIYNVTGRGIIITGDTTEIFNGTIQSSDIKNLKVIDDVTPAIILCIFAVGSFGYIWLAMGIPN